MPFFPKISTPKENKPHVGGLLAPTGKCSDLAHIGTGLFIHLLIERMKTVFGTLYVAFYRVEMLGLVN